MRQWKEAGDAELARLADEPAFRPKIHGSLAKAIIRGRHSFKMRNLKILKLCAEDDDIDDRLARVTAAAWLLEHHAVNEK